MVLLSLSDTMCVWEGVGEMVQELSHAACVLESVE